MGGRLELQSCPDEGTTVKITVPMSEILIREGDGVT
jgi:signal transduction histidine kinase